MSSTKKPYRINNKDVVVKAENALYNGDIANVENAEDAIDNLNGRVSTLEQSGGSGGGGSSSNPYSGKLFAFMGDSYTHPGTWCTRLCTVLGATKGYNAAWSSACWRRVIVSNVVRGAFAQAKGIVDYYANSSTKPDYIIALLGVNDATGIHGKSNIVLGDIDYGKVYYNTINDTSGEYDQLGFVKYGTNHVDTENPFWKYVRCTTKTYNWANENIKGINRQYLIDPATWIYDAACDASIASSYSTTAMTDCLDQTMATGGMQAAIAYLRYHLPNAIIKIGFTPMGIMLGEPNGAKSEIVSLCERMKEVADLYGVDYIETRECGYSPIVEKDIECQGGGGHPSAIGQQRIGDYIARMLLGNDSHF